MSVDFYSNQKTTMFINRAYEKRTISFGKTDRFGNRKWYSLFYELTMSYVKITKV